MAQRIARRFPSALAGYWRAFAIHRRVGSFQGIITTWEKLGELYAQVGERATSLGFYVAAGRAKEAAEVATGLDGEAVAHHLHPEFERWRRAAAYKVMSEAGRLLPVEYVAVALPIVLEDAEKEPDGLMAPQPTYSARRALAALVFSAPEGLRPRALGVLEEMVSHPLLEQSQSAARALVLATNAGLTDARTLLVDRYLDDHANCGIAPDWLAEEAASDDAICSEFRDAALRDHRGALQVLVMADKIGDDPDLRDACTRLTRRSAEIETIRERQTESGGTEVSIGMGIDMEGPGIVAAAAADDARAALLDRLLSIVLDGREPENNRASAATAMFNFAKALTDDQAAQAASALADLALGRYSASPWDLDNAHPLSRWQVRLTIPNGLRIAALMALAAVVGSHPEIDGDGLAVAASSALQDDAPEVVAAAFDAASRAPELTLPVDLEAGLAHPHAEVQLAALTAWAVRMEQLPPDELLPGLLGSSGINVRLQLIAMAAEWTGGRGTLEVIAATDPDAYVRAKTAERVGRLTDDIEAG